MNAKSLSLFREISFNAGKIEAYIPMEPLHPATFDHFCEDGWTYWSDLIFRRNYWEWRGLTCRVILLRINLRNFEFSKSQRKCLRRNRDLKCYVRPLRVNSQHGELFRKHATRFDQNPPQGIGGFFSMFSNIQPSLGLQFDVYEGEKLVAASFSHLGLRSMAGNYAIYDPASSPERSLGTYTLLLEIEYARHSGRPYYYPGFVYDLPSEFDYKLNFNALEYFDWWGNWYPLERMAVRRWRDEWPPALNAGEIIREGIFSNQ